MNRVKRALKIRHIRHCCSGVELPVMNSEALVITIDQGTVSLVVYGETGRPMGTAFAFLKPTWLVTAKHVAFRKNALREDVPRSDLQICPYQRPIVPARILFAHPEVDLAVLEVEAPVCSRPLYPAHHKIASAAGLIFAGLSPSRATPAAHTVLFSRITGYELEVRERHTLQEETVAFAAPESEGGNSGGPILGTIGSVVGVVIENFQRDDHLWARGTSIEPLVNHLEFR